MPAPSCSADEFLALWKRLGSATLVAKELKISSRAVASRRNEIAAKLGVELDTWNDQRVTQAKTLIAGARIEKVIRNGKVVVFSDAHYIPGVRSTAHRALVKMIPEIRPEAIVCNGDAFDGSSISRYPRIGWDKKPTVIEELNAVKERLGEIEKVKSGADLIWPLGNHCARYESFLAANAPQYEGVPGFRLRDSFPFWKPCWRLDINPGTHHGWTVIKHRGSKGGKHGTLNNALHSGSVHFVAGHDHQFYVRKITNTRGTCWAVNTGTLADPEGPQFNDYVEDDSALDWGSGFAILTYQDGELLMPELVFVRREGVVEFRGERIEV